VPENSSGTSSVRSALNRSPETSLLCLGPIVTMFFFSFFVLLVVES
jgi:hypothetical protein